MPLDGYDDQFWRAVYPSNVYKAIPAAHMDIMMWLVVLVWDKDAITKVCVDLHSTLRAAPGPVRGKMCMPVAIVIKIEVRKGSCTKVLHVVRSGVEKDS